MGRLATSQVRNCRISFTRQDDCSSKGRSIPDPTLRHRNSLESDFMTLPKPYDISVVLLDQALQVRRSSTLETHPTTAVSPLHLLAYLAHHLGEMFPVLRYFGTSVETPLSLMDRHFDRSRASVIGIMKTMESTFSAGSGSLWLRQTVNHDANLLKKLLAEGNLYSPTDFLRRRRGT